MLKRWNFLETGFYEGIKVGLIIVAVGVMMAMLCGLCGAVVWGFRDSHDGIILAGFGYTAFFAYMASLVAFAGGFGAVVVGLAFKVLTRSA